MSSYKLVKANTVECTSLHSDEGILGMVKWVLFFSLWAGRTAGYFIWLQRDKQARMKRWTCVPAVTALLTKCCCTLQGPVNNYSRGEAKRDVIVCYCIHLGRRHGSQLMNQLEQGIEVSTGARKPGLRASHYVMQLCALPLSFWLERWWIFNSFMQNGTVSSGRFAKKPIPSYSSALRCFPCKANYHHVKKINHLNSSQKEYSNYLVVPEEGERKGSTLQFFSCLQ